MNTEQQIEETKECISNIQKQLVMKLSSLKLTDSEKIDLILDISMVMSVSLTLGKLEHQLELETLSEEFINQIIK